ncbi:MAG: LuxR C-terminal-related transcriptional regulator [Proteobacteria bacterium]|nr:LuxR C-terminal-related transcriptional regulator [Pseudomonadota bacterium]
MDNPLTTRPAAALVERPRLLQRLALARSRRCVVVQGPAGSGKTSLLQAWRRELVSVGVEVAWVAVDDGGGAGGTDGTGTGNGNGDGDGDGDGDAEPARFAERLLAALAALDAGVVREASLLAGRGSDEAAFETLAIALVRGLAAWRRELVLVVDDAHLLRAPGPLAALQLLLDHGPPNLRCAFTSRHAVALTLGRWRDRGELLEIGPDELRFTPDESALLLRQQLGAIDDRQAQALHALTDGWAAGLKLLCLERRQGAPAAGTHERVQNPQAFARYFERELLSRLAAPLQQLLVCAALPERFNAELLAALLDSPAQQAAAWPQRLAELEAQGLFVAPVGAPLGAAAAGGEAQAWWRMHPLLRDVLLARLRARPAAEQRALHARAWRWFAAQGAAPDLVHEAVRHAVQAGEDAAAADLVQAHAERLFVAGDVQRVVGLVRLLPAAMLDARPGLRLWVAWAQLYERRLADCRASLQRLQQEMAAAAPAERFRLTLLRGMFAVQSDDTAGALAIQPELQQPPPAADAVALAGRRNLLTWLHLYRGDYEQARRVQLERHDAGDDLRGTPFGTLVGRSLVGLTHAVQGQMIQAERLYRDVLHEAEQRGAGAIDATCLAAGLLGEVLYELNDPAAALRLLEPRLDVLDRVSIPDTVVRVMLAVSRSRWLSGRPLDAYAYLEQTADQAEALALDRLHAYALLEQVRWHLRRFDEAAARVPLARLERLDERHAEAEPGVLSEILVAAERARIEQCQYRGDLSGAQSRLRALIEVCRQRGRLRRVADLQLQSAAVARRLGEEDKARAHAREALRLGHALGLVRTLLDAHGQALAVVAEARLDPQLDARLVFYAERLEAAAHELARPGAPPPAASTPAATRAALAGLSPREAEIVSLLVRSLSNKRIARALNLSIDTVKWHLKNVYGKLGVSGRDEVILRVRDAAGAAPP